MKASVRRYNSKDAFMQKGLFPMVDEFLRTIVLINTANE